MNELQIMWDMIVPLIIAGISIGLVLSIVAGSIKIGWKLAPYLIVISLIIWYIQI